jgi:hypothetical protein
MYVILQGQTLIEEENVEVCPEKLPDGVVDENVDVHLIRKYFTNDAWLLVMDVIQQKQRDPVFVCKCCFHDLHDEPSIVCDHCLLWYHIRCVGLKRGPKSKHWFCCTCHQ